MPGPLFVTTTQQVRHAVFAIEKKPPTIFKPAGTNAAVVLGQFAWGPSQVLTESTSPKDLTNMVAPAGMDRENSAFAAINRKGFPRLFFIRVMGAGGVAAYADLSDVTPTIILRVTLKYPGTAGNSVTWTVATATDADPNHFDLTVAVTGMSGTTSETIPNVNFSGVGTDSTFSLGSSLLIGSISKTSAGRPLNGTGSFANGTTPAVTSGDYVGTPGLGDKGVALCEGSGVLRVVFADDPGNVIRAAVNAGLVAHCDKMGDRVVFINGNSGQTLAQAQADKLNYISDRALYCDPWCNQFDPQGVAQLIPSGSYAASARCQLPASTSIAWKDESVQAFFDGINSLEFDRGDGAGSNTSLGLMTFIKEDSGGFSIEADVTCAAAIDSTRANLTRRCITDFIALTAKTNLRPYVDIPNLTLYQDDILAAVTRFMDGLKDASTGRDPVHTEHIVDWDMDDLSTDNTPDEIQAGHFHIPLDVEDSVGMHQIFININSGEGVTVTHR